MRKQKTAVQHAPGSKRTVLCPMLLTSVAMQPQAFNRAENEEQRCEHHNKCQRINALQLKIITCTGNQHHQQCTNATGQRVGMIALVLYHLVVFVPGHSSQNSNSRIKKHTTLCDNADCRNNTDYTGNNTC